MANELTIDAPELLPRVDTGLLTVANVIDTDGHAIHYGVKYTSEGCGKNRVIPAEGEDKVFDELDETTSVQFGQYRGFDLSLLLHKGEAQGLVERAFTASESYGVEKAVQSLLLNPNAVDITPTPGTAVTSPRLALGLLEQYAKDNYSGRPILHGNSLAIGFIPELQVDGVRLSTIHGTPIANGGGYATNGPGAAVAGDGTAWLYISGQVNIWRGQVQVNAEPVYDLKSNRELGLAERRYAATVDCFVAAILVGIS
jgi:hypothetical protein